ncbi:MAG: ABC transporter ATP-binding protein [Anaerolineae bacterium]
MTCLELQDVHSYYGNIHALKGISLTVEEGEVVTLIGGNGAGKTTTLRTISGLMHPRQGKILYRGEDITHTPPAEIVRKGITQVPEGRRIFGTLTVQENLEMGAYTREDKEEIAQSLEYVFHLFPRLKERRKQAGGTLSGGEQQMLAVGRALMAKPTLMLMDEPSMGLAPLLVEDLFEVIQTINEQGVTVLLVEQNAHLALSVADRGYVLETGTIQLQGSAEELAQNPQVREAYLGGA